MGKGKSLLKARRAPKIPRVSKLQADQINRKFYGAEPPISDRARWLTWCSFMVDPEEAREWLATYLAQSGRSCVRVPDAWVNPSVCHRARLKSLGAPFTATQDRLLEEGIAEVLSHARDADSTVERPAVIDRVRERFSEVMGELEGLFDDGFPEPFNLEAWCRERSVSPTIAGRMLAKLRPRLDELTAVMLKSDGQVVEGYARYKRGQVSVMREDLSMVVSTLERMVENQKKAREVSKPKPVSMEKKLKRISEVYLKHSREFNVTSIDPSKVVGASEVWTLNVKYKLVTVYRASKGQRLDVQTCKVINEDRESSCTYRLGRGKKPAIVVDSLIGRARSELRAVVSDLKTASLAERVNENTVILRVF